MSICRLGICARTIAGVFLLTAAAWLPAQELNHPLAPKLGIPATPALLYEQSVLPDGQGLPEGAGSVDQGRRLYAQHCLACHGPEGQGGINDVLVGGRGSLATGTPVKTIGSYWPYATTLFAYVRSAMPYTTPGILSNDETYALTAYLLYLNDLLADDVMLDARSLPQITMPNQAGFQHRD